MAARDDQREHVLEALAAHILQTGLSQASLRQLATAAGVSDRMLLYYFTDKTEIMARVMERLAGRMSARLDLAIPNGAGLTPEAFMAQAGRFVLDPQFLPYMRVWLEIVAAAARREEPFTQISRQVTHGFLEWIAQRIDQPPGAAREGTAAMILALVDGLVLVEVGAGREHAQRALEMLEARARTASRH